MSLVARLKAEAVKHYDRLRRGEVLRFGPLSVVRTLHLAHLNARIGTAERDLARAQSGVRETAPADRRSVVFLHNSYYNFLYLAAALRKRGWDAVSVNVDDPKSPDARFFHGSDIDLFDADPERFEANMAKFFAAVPGRFRMLHFYGPGRMSLFPARFDRGERFEAVPADFLALKAQGLKIGYSVCGCYDGVAQSHVLAWSGICNKCVWQNEPRRCNDLRNVAWGHKVHMVCDLVATEGFPALDWQSGNPKVVREPLTTAVDSERWRPDIAIPEKYRLAREPGELIVYHGVGNFSERTKNGRNVKGTGAVIDAIERLKSEGMKVRLEFVTNLPSTEVRFIQAQADVIVDQLNYGRYGATAREGMMLGKPTICHINKTERAGEAHLQSIETCPLVSANEETVYAALRDLLSDDGKRRAIGQASREFALKWHGADACAERFERIYDRLQQGIAPSDTRAPAEPALA